MFEIGVPGVMAVALGQALSDDLAMITCYWTAASLTVINNTSTAPGIDPWQLRIWITREGAHLTGFKLLKAKTRAILFPLCKSQNVNLRGIVSRRC